jgi:hypothetical protein
MPGHSQVIRITQNNPRRLATVRHLGQQKKSKTLNNCQVYKNVETIPEHMGATMHSGMNKTIPNIVYQQLSHIHVDEIKR